MIDLKIWKNTEKLWKLSTDSFIQILSQMLRNSSSETVGLNDELGDIA